MAWFAPVAAAGARVAAKVGVRGARATRRELDLSSGDRHRGRRGRNRERRRSPVTTAVVLGLLFLIVAPVVLAIYGSIQIMTGAQGDTAWAAEIAGSAGAMVKAVSNGACPLPPERMAEEVAKVDGIADPATIVPAFDAYCGAAVAYELDWALIAGIGRMECFHGTNRDPGCNPDLRNADGTRRTNGSGARGPLQFLGSSWRTSAGTFDPEVAGPPVPEGQEQLAGYGTDGDGDGIADPWVFRDAAFSAARYLVRLGGQTDQARAAFGYYNGGGATFDPNHFYHQGVLQHADAYRRAMPPNVPSGVRVTTPAGVEQTTVEGITVNVAIADNVRRMVQAAHADGIPLSGDGYRSAEDQIRLRRDHCGPTHYDIYEKPSSQCHPPTATPGHSNHEKGLAIDFECGGNGNYIPSHDSPCFRWLAAHAATYGFYNLPSEPWHWSIDGR